MALITDLAMDSAPGSNKNWGIPLKTLGVIGVGNGREFATAGTTTLAVNGGEGSFVTPRVIWSIPIPKLGNPNSRVRIKAITIATKPTAPAIAVVARRRLEK